MDFPELNLQSASWIVAEVGALNWGLTEAFNTNLVTELLGTGNEGPLYLVIGLAGALALADKLGLVDLAEMS
jgi:uncharacterized membrane protein YuzA (DUF378 family)